MKLLKKWRFIALHIVDDGQLCLVFRRPTNKSVLKDVIRDLTLALRYLWGRHYVPLRQLAQQVHLSERQLRTILTVDATPSIHPHVTTFLLIAFELVPGLLIKRF